MDKKILERAGLSKGEVEVYLTLLKTGSCRVTKIAQETGLHRTNIYDTLEKLKEKGLAAYVIRENRKYFSATHPDKLLDYINEKRDEIITLLPKLQECMAHSADESVVEIYKGKEGLKTVFRDILKKGRDYMVFAEEGHIQMVLPHFYAQFNKNMDEEKIRVRVLTRNPEKIAKRELMQIKTFPEMISYPTATAIYGENVAIFVWDEPYYAILIKSRQIANSYANFFDAFWNMSS